MTAGRTVKMVVAFLGWLLIAGGGLATVPLDPAGAATGRTEVATVDGVVSMIGAAHQRIDNPTTAGPSTVALPQGSEAVALAMALAMLQGQYIRPGPRIWPQTDGLQVIELETWLAIDPGAFRDHRGWGISGSIFSGIVTVRAEATAARTIWRFSDRTVICDGPGVEYTPGAAGPAPCGRYFEHTTSVGPNAMEVFIQYDVEWRSSNGGSGSLVMTSGSVGSFPLSIGEIQGIGTGGTQRVPGGSNVPPTGDIPSEDPGDGCDFLMALVCGARDAAEWFGEEVIWNNLPPEAQWVLQQVWSFLQGCAAFVGEVFANAFDMLQQLGDAVTDPEKFIREKWLVAKGIYDAIQEAHANDELLEFAREVFGDVIEEDLLRSDPAQWVGKFGCELAVGILTGGAAASSGRLGRLINRSDELLDRITTWRRNRNNRPDDDPNRPGTPPCRSSFPTGTMVLMADGSLLAIEDIERGDEVLAADEETGTWQARPVLDQWWDIHRGSMGTITMTDGDSVEATDNHPFWVTNDGAWVELADVESGDVLLTPDGVTTVAAVDLDPAKPTLVWELNVGIDHTFAVQAGDDEVLVHNGCGDPPSGDSLRRKRQNDPDFDALGITDEQIQGAWDRYEGDLDADTWLDRYATLQKNRDRGGVFETGALGHRDVDLPKNHDELTGTGTIPDGIRRNADGSIAEIVEVKDYGPTNPLDTGSNASRMVDYAAANDTDFTLVIGENTRLTGPMADKIRDAARDSGGTFRVLRPDADGNMIPVPLDQLDIAPGQ